MPEGAYSGRLQFNPDTEFHMDEDGNHVVTDDGGKTWRYATEDDSSHNSRHHQQFAVVDSTANRFAELAYESGHEAAERQLLEEQPHHFSPNVLGEQLRSHPDKHAPKVTSHTDAWSADNE